MKEGKTGEIVSLEEKIERKMKEEKTGQIVS